MGKPKNPIVGHVEFRSHDGERLEKFYSQLFTWKFAEGMPDYRVFLAGKDSGGGIMKITDGSPTGLLNYVQVDDLPSHEKKIEELGGKVHVRGEEVPGRGWFSLFSDVDGNTLGLWKNWEKPKKKAIKKAKKAEKKAAKAEKRAHEQAETAGEIAEKAQHAVEEQHAKKEKADKADKKKKAR